MDVTLQVEEADVTPEYIADEFAAGLALMVCQFGIRGFPDGTPMFATAGSVEACTSTLRVVHDTEEGSGVRRRRDVNATTTVRAYVLEDTGLPRRRLAVVSGLTLLGAALAAPSSFGAAAFGVPLVSLALATGTTTTAPGSESPAGGGGGLGNSGKVAIAVSCSAAVLLALALAEYRYRRKREAPVRRGHPGWPVEKPTPQWGTLGDGRGGVSDFDVAGGVLLLDHGLEPGSRAWASWAGSAPQPHPELKVLGRGLPRDSALRPHLNAAAPAPQRPASPHAAASEEYHPELLNLEHGWARLPPPQPGRTMAPSRLSMAPSRLSMAPSINYLDLRPNTPRVASPSPLHWDYAQGGW